MLSKKLLTEKIYFNIQAQSLFLVRKFSIFGELNYSLVLDPPLHSLLAFRFLALGPLHFLNINFSLGKTREVMFNFLNELRKHYVCK